MLSRLFSALKRYFDTSREHYEPSGDPFLELNLADVRRTLRPTELGSEHGARDLPPANASSPDHNERQFLALFSNELERCVKECELRLGGYAERLRGLRLSTLTVDIIGVAESTRQNIDAEADRSSNELFGERTRLSGLQKDLARFRHSHGLLREPVERKPPTLVYGVLILMLVLEVPLNAMMLARGDDRGLLGGGVQALVLAVLNLFVAFTAGRAFLPYLHHRSLIRRVVALALIACCAVFITAFNLMVGHYRDSLGSAVTDPGQVALQRLLESPLVLADLQSYMLFAIGFIFATVAALDGFKSDDHYPGYGRIASVASQAQDEFAASRRSCVEELADLRDSGLRQIKELAQAAELAQRQNGILRARQQQITQRYRAHRDYLGRCLMTMIAEYRRANTAARQSPAPTYFDTDLTLPELLLTEFAPTDLREDELQDAVEKGTTRIVEAFDAASRRLPTVEQLSTSDDSDASE
jgi:hypothetical protein